MRFARGSTRPARNSPELPRVASARGRRFTLEHHPFRTVQVEALGMVDPELAHDRLLAAARRPCKYPYRYRPGALMSGAAAQVETRELQRLADSGLPARVRGALEHALHIVADDLPPRLAETLGDLEQQLFRLAEQARSPSIEASYLQILRTVRANRDALAPAMLAQVEDRLAGLRRPPAGLSGDAAVSAPMALSLGLVDDIELQEDALLGEIAQRQQARASLGLHLIGQRFGVLAAAPAFEARRLPLGPQSMCSCLRAAAAALQVSLEARTLLYRSFERAVMAHYAELVELLNRSFAADGILPDLTYVPVRLRPRTAGDAANTSPTLHAEAPARSGASGGRRDTPAPGVHPHTGWLGQAPAVVPVDDGTAYAGLQQLLSSRRELIGRLRTGASAEPQHLATRDVVEALGSLQDAATQGAGTPRDLGALRESVLGMVRQQRGASAGLSREDSDTFELLGLLYAQLQREMRADTPASDLLRRLQVPLLRVALQDHGFFVRPQHPARILLNVVAESGARWLDDADLDPELLEPLQEAVGEVVEHYQGDAAVFEASTRRLQAQLQHLAHTAELSERRVVEAARGKEKLTVAKRRAAEEVAALVGQAPLPRFVRALLNQAWTDVLTLTLLRQGDESEEWRQQLDITRQMVASCLPGGSAPRDPALCAHVESSLAQVGYHAEEAAAIARQLAGLVDDDEDDPASRTELTMKLKARTRLGEEAALVTPALPPRTAAEDASYEELRVLPFGTWIEFVTNQQGDVVRRRLSWYSSVTGNALFVNQRGQRVGEQTLDGLARMLARGQARIVTAERASLVDRAWQATLNALRSFAGGDAPRPEPAA